jgi:hypothetical protein
LETAYELSANVADIPRFFIWESALTSAAEFFAVTAVAKEWGVIFLRFRLSDAPEWMSWKKRVSIANYVIGTAYRHSSD